MIRLFTPLFVFMARSLAVVLIISLVVPLTITAYFSDAETAKKQQFVAGELQFAELPDLAEDVYLGVGLRESATFTLPTAVSSSSIPAKLDITATATGDDLFCAALMLHAEGYIGTVTGQAASFASPTLKPNGDWDLTLTYVNEAVTFTHGDTCLVSIVVTAWQETMTKETAGYYDSYTYQIPVTAHLVVLNEVLAKPESGEREFIELFNNSDLPIDVLDFNITERSGSGATINHKITNTPISAGALIAYDNSLSTIVPPRGFLALRYNSGSYLNDSADELQLIDTSGTVVDRYSYTNAVLGKSDARIPDGVGAWVDPIPTPNAANVLEAPLVTVELEEIAALAELTVPVDVVTENEVATDTATVTEEILTPEEVVEIPATDTTEQVTEETEPNNQESATAPIADQAEGEIAEVIESIDERETEESDEVEVTEPEESEAIEETAEVTLEQNI